MTPLEKLRQIEEKYGKQGTKQAIPSFFSFRKKKIEMIIEMEKILGVDLTSLWKLSYADIEKLLKLIKEKVGK